MAARQAPLSSPQLLGAAEAKDLTPLHTLGCLCAKSASQEQPWVLPLPPNPPSSAAPPGCWATHLGRVSREPSDFPTLWPHSQC